MKLPTYSHHKASGNARVWLNGRSYYLGEYGSAASRLKYAELLMKHTTGTLVDPIAPTVGQDTGPTIHMICADYILHAATYYRKNGKKTAEYDCIKSAMRPLTELFGDSPAKDFDSVALRLVRQKMVDEKDWCRSYINKSIARIVRMFRHSLKFKLIPPGIIADLETVESLEAGRTTAKDYDPRTEVPAETIEAIKSKADQMTRDMIDLSLLCGSRGGELCLLTPQMISEVDGVHAAVLEDHKMKHKGRVRVLVFGPRCMEILRRNWPASTTSRFFPVQRRTFTDRIKRVCDALEIPQITSHWLRHSSATSYRRQHGLDVTQALLGHASAATTEIYADVDISKLAAVARDHG